MDGRAFLAIAGQLLAGGTEAHWRSAAGRAYYALLLEGREALRRWGFGSPPRHQVHAFVRLRFGNTPDRDLQLIGKSLERLGSLRNRADYELVPSTWFVTAIKARQAISDATGALALLDGIDGDPARRAVAVSAIRAAWP
jgi:hypothetical protein